MFGKLSHILFKTLIVLALILMTYCAFSGIKPISCDIDENGGSISIVGNEIPIESSEIIDAYNDAEERASELIPKKLRVALKRISELLKLG